MSRRWDAGSRTVGREEVAELWRGRESGAKLLVGGAGFDPRMSVAYECISEVCPVAVDVILIRMEPLATDPATEGPAREGRERLEAAAAQAGGTVSEHAADAEGAGATSMTIVRDFFEAKLIDDYEEIAVDVSALPRSIAFPLIRGLLEMADRGEWNGDLHVLACDNPRIDRLVNGEGIDGVASLPGFGARSEPEGGGPLIWVPVLGEDETKRVEMLYRELSPNEVCPVLPFPAKNPRRADDLIGEYEELLIERIAVEPRNLIYASEENPFDLYRILCRLRDRYAESLEPLGETRMVLSTHSSKLLSIGVLLTAYELGLEVQHASPSLYTLAEPESVQALSEENLVVDLWLTGEPYA
jgi:hypothetical protein